MRDFRQKSDVVILLVENVRHLIMYYGKNNDNHHHHQQQQQHLKVVLFFNLFQDLAVEIVDDMPATLEAQARLFASAGLVLAPNGGWAPNVIFMPPETQILLVFLSCTLKGVGFFILKI